MKKKLACIDLGGTAMKAGVCGRDGVLEEQCILPIYDVFGDIVCETEQFVNRMRETYEICGLAVSAPGAVDIESGIIGGKSALPCIHGPSWIRVFSERLKIPVSIENDANCAALAELFFGNGRGYRNLAFVVCGTGIGGAVVSDRKICRGEHLYGGEFGCMVMRNNRGELSTFSREASTMSFVRKMQKRFPEETWDGKKVFAQAEKGNRYCREAIDTFYYNLAEGIFNIQHVLDPEIILLGGGISSRQDFVMNIRKKLLEIVFKTEKLAETKVILPNVAGCSYRQDANLAGAAGHFFQFYGEDNF